ncbi:Histidine kinase-like ATPase, ATP-binding domain-containing protein [Cynara cardunculus var. scolymus]|uniref:Histidine kinase-like ATPase, ATP-binding domain-containing protein n=1 Tax=Cynara cardunculus var. scolymus TaxID=59895 RepID=A0A103XVZ0_CYNCS|nr:Histidine kinase-like ATPase, ATP-binding domain-containing protein [Cynara cardunculus var. scolymus]
MDVRMNPESTVVDLIEPTIGEGIQTVSKNDVQASDRSSLCFSDTDVIEESNGRPSKKPKIEEKTLTCALPQGFLDPMNHDERSQSILEYGDSAKAAVPSMSKQFWKAGDYEGSPNNTESISHPDGMDHVRVHPRFLHSNATSHKWALGAFAELLDNSLDEVRTGATYVHVDVLNNERVTHNKMLLVKDLLDSLFFYPRVFISYMMTDNGGGMTPEKMRACMSLGYSVKSKLANTIDGNGFKTSTMRLGADVLVYTRCPGQDGRRCVFISWHLIIGLVSIGYPRLSLSHSHALCISNQIPLLSIFSSTQSIGMLSYTFLMETGKEDIVVPMVRHLTLFLYPCKLVDFEKRGEEWGMMARSSPADWKRNMETLVRWSPYSSEEGLLQQFDFLNDQGTHIIIYNLWEDEEGQLELDFDTDLHDIQIRGVNRDPKKIEMAKDYPNSRHFLTHRHSLRSYASILYLSIPNGFRIILRGEDVIHHKIVDDMMLTEKVMYKPTQPNADGTRKDQNLMVAVVTIGFVKDAKDHIDVQGFNVYHKNRLIKPFWRVWNAAGSDGRGVIGVLEADFIEPAHDKQGFERTTVLSRLENRLVAIQKKYWFDSLSLDLIWPTINFDRSTNCQEIGYAKRCKSVSDTKCRPSMKDESDRHIAPTGIDTIDARVKLRPIRKLEASKFLECAQNDEIPEAYACTSREKQASTRRLPSEVATTNGDGHASTDYNGDTVAKLREENLVLRQRLEGSERVMINNLLSDLQYERDKVVSLENQNDVMLHGQVLKAQEKIEELDREQISLIDIFSEERQRRDHQEETLRKRWKEAMDTIEDLRGQIKVLESSRVLGSPGLNAGGLEKGGKFGGGYGKDGGCGKGDGGGN